MCRVAVDVSGCHFFWRLRVPSAAGHFDGIWCVAKRLWTHPAPVTPIALGTTHQMPPLLCLEGHLWKPEWGWRIVSGVILGYETYKVSVVRENLFLVFLISCSWAAQIQSRPLQVTPPHALGLGSMPFLTVSLNCPSAWNLLQRWEILDNLTSSGNCYEKKNPVIVQSVPGLFFLCIVWVPACCCFPLHGSFTLFCPTPCCPHLDGAHPHEWGTGPSFGKRWFRVQMSFSSSTSLLSAFHSKRALFYPYGLCPLGGRWQWFKIILCLYNKAGFHVTVSFGDACHNHFIFFPRVWNRIVSQGWEESVFAFLVNIDPRRTGDKGTQLKS